MKKTLGTMVAIMIAAVLIGTFIAAKYATAGEKAKDGRFISYDNGTVLDTKTNLMWAAKDNGSGISWADAKSYCENYRGGGYTNWRMPTHDELAGLYDEAKTYKTGRGAVVHLTNLIRLTSFGVWASETNFGKLANLSFYSGKRFWARETGAFGDNRALPVRSVK